MFSASSYLSHFTRYSSPVLPCRFALIVSTSYSGFHLISTLVVNLIFLEAGSSKDM